MKKVAIFNNFDEISGKFKTLRELEEYINEWVKVNFYRIESITQSECDADADRSFTITILYEDGSDANGQ